MATPFEREILEHHYTSGSAFPRPSELYWATVNKFCDAGLLGRVTSSDGQIDRVVAIEEPIRLYMEALAAVPFPVKTWAMPNTGAR